MLNLAKVSFVLDNSCDNLREEEKTALPSSALFSFNSEIESVTSRWVARFRYSLPQMHREK
jgi:hypothetical protein